ncbi:MAG: MBL fold metallo-hydrolase [Alphaproteobacteria bacterium]|jgi:glyoxylase-like metal-dependent hydrolase (beta-lactamase superfamily II)|nr:MBL fold metallo-hydrolase [Alphaproteobacteria bacterium]MDP6515605.1 MBL fold metallo-hydrolase [Alphaproteobacteria bacterium]
MAAAPEHSRPEVPAHGAPVPVAPGVAWLRMPLPFRLDHINLWLLDDGTGRTLVDSGINRPEVQDAWRDVFAGPLVERPARRLIVTHFHPDHIGLAGWLSTELDIPLWATEREWLMGRLAGADRGDDRTESRRAFYRGHGADGAIVKSLDQWFGSYRISVSPVPPSFRRIADGDEIDIDGRPWRVITGGGHSPEHACLHDPETATLISGDLVLPRITPNVAVWDTQPEADPLAGYLAALDRLRGLPEDTLVLPSHGRPFHGLHRRLDELEGHHRDRLDETLAACAEPRSAIEIVPVLFRRALDVHQTALAIGEALAHLHCLVGQGRLTRTRDDDGVVLFQRTS